MHFYSYTLIPLPLGIRLPFGVLLHPYTLTLWGTLTLTLYPYTLMPVLFEYTLLLYPSTFTLWSILTLLPVYPCTLWNIITLTLLPLYPCTHTRCQYKRIPLPFGAPLPSGANTSSSWASQGRVVRLDGLQKDTAAPFGD